MWSRRRRNPASIFSGLQLRHRLPQEHRGYQLDICENDEARYELCLKWMEEQRNRYYQGLRETQEDILNSRSDHFKPYSREARMLIGERRWSESQLAKGIVGQEQMYGRWAAVYKGSSRAGGRAS